MGILREEHNGNFDFPVEMQFLQTAMPLSMEAAMIPNTMGRALVRTDTNVPLAIHRSSYKPTLHAEVYDSVKTAIRQANLGDYSVTTQTSHDGARFWGEVLFDNIVEHDPIVGNYTQFRIRFYNSYDGAWALQVSTDALRLWCLNGCTMPDTITKMHQKHIGKIDIDLYAYSIQHGATSFFEHQEKWKAWRNFDIYDAEVSELFRTYLASEYPKVGRVNQKALDQLTKNWHNEKAVLGSNLWAAYNAATAWQTHTNDYKSPVDVQRKRENKVAMMLRSHVWHNYSQEAEKKAKRAA